MAKKKSDKETEPKKVSTKRFSAFLKNETTHFVIGLISVIFAVYLLLAFTSFFFTGAADQSILDNQQPGELMQTANHVKNYAGARGAQLAEFLINECFGLAAYFIILFLAVVGMKLMKAYQFRIWKWFMSCSILLIWFSITLGFIFDGTFGDSFIYPGGLHGHNVSNWLISQIGIPGLGLLLFIAALLFFIYLSNETILVIRKALRPSFRRKKKEDQTISATEENPIKEAPRKEESRKEFSNPGPAIVDFELEQPTKKEEEVEEQVPFPFESKQVTEPAVIEEPAYTNEEEEVENTDEPDFSISEETNEEDEAYKGPVLPPYNPRLDLENYKFPSLDLLNEYEDDGPNIDMEEQNANKDRIIKVLRSFGIEISSIKASVGPTITLYEITPAEGVRISKIRNLEDDIALSLSALGIRIIAPIPGKGTIGIEVPNANPRIVPMKSILNSKKFQETTYELPVALGKTITNEVFMVDLAKAPQAGCRNIKEYNAKFINRQLNPEKGHRFMPYIVIIIDEFGDLIMTAGKEVELPICRIAQLARAVGIHAIIATQRPTTNIITGTIKANFPARVAFRVAAMMDSRTILDRSGAQQLIGKGDMLYLQGNDPVRVQCAFVDTPEVEKIANYISKQQGYTTAFMLPEYVGEESESSVGEVDMNRLDPMFEDAARLVVIHQQGSTSLIQRKFSIGYNRAGRIMDQLEKAGIVGPTQGSKARDVLCMDETDLEMKLNNLQQ